MQQINQPSKIEVCCCQDLRNERPLQDPLTYPNEETGREEPVAIDGGLRNWGKWGFSANL